MEKAEFMIKSGQVEGEKGTAQRFSSDFRYKSPVAGCLQGFRVRFRLLRKSVCRLSGSYPRQIRSSPYNRHRVSENLGSL